MDPRKRQRSLSPREAEPEDGAAAQRNCGHDPFRWAILPAAADRRLGDWQSRPIVCDINEA